MIDEGRGRNFVFTKTSGVLAGVSLEVLVSYRDNAGECFMHAPRLVARESSSKSFLTWKSALSIESRKFTSPRRLEN